MANPSPSRDDRFWETAREEIEAGYEVTVMKGGRAICCATLSELWMARAEFEDRHLAAPAGGAAGEG